MWPFVVIGLIPAVPAVIQLVFMLGRGQIRLRGGSVIRRDENPGRYWGIVALHVPLLAISFRFIYYGLSGS